MLTIALIPHCEAHVQHITQRPGQEQGRMAQRDHLPHRPFPAPRILDLPPAPARIAPVPPAYLGIELQGLGSSAKSTEALAQNLGA